MDKQIIISRTAYSNGWGKAPYKTVSGLTHEERRALCDGTAVVIMLGCPPSGGGNRTGITIREVYEYKGRFYHRLPCPEILNAIGEEYK